MQIYGKFDGFPINSALFGLVIYDPCIHGTEIVYLPIWLVFVFQVIFFRILPW